MADKSYKQPLFNLPVIICSFFIVFYLGLLLLYAQEDKEDAEIAEARRETEAAVAPKLNRREPLTAESVHSVSAAETETETGTEAEVKQPIIVNADKIEYSATTKDVIATGNVEVDYKGSKLTCQKMVINTETKDAEAEGNARLEDSQGVKEGSKITYNFETKAGTIIDAQFRSNPYFGSAAVIDKPGPDEFIIKKGFLGTCSFDHPHYRIGFKKANYFPDDKIQTKGDTVYIGDVPLMYVPQYNHSLKEPLMHVQIVPGKKKDWGGYMLTTWRCNLTENVNGRLYVDYRDLLGFAYGYGLNYDSPAFGKGDLKYYYTEEDPKKFDPKDAPNTEFQRALTRWRHKWSIGTYTDFTAQFVKVLDRKRKNDLNYDPDTDSFLEQYFLREYEKDTEPLTYAQFHHSFAYSSFDLYLQKRLNHWYDQLNKLPEITYSLPNVQIENSNFYFSDTSEFSNLNKKPPAGSVDIPETNSIRFDTGNQFTFPMKVAFIEFSPYAKIQETFYNQDVYGAATLFRTIFYSGANISTKFYRLFDIKSNFLGMDINRLRHIITPTIAYTYRHTPTIPSSKIKQIDDPDSINGASQVAALELSNKLQTKRQGSSVDIVDFRVNTSYTFKPKEGDKRGSSFSDFVFNLELLPYSWLRVVSDATYKHSGNHNDKNYNKFINGNINFEFDFGKERQFGIGQRFEKKGGNALTYALKWRLTPKWKFYLYQRRQFSKTATIKSGLREQEYTISRDLHCWEVDLTYNITRGVSKQVWLMFRLKAFPEMEFDYNQIYHQPKPGSQSEPNTG